MWPHERAETHIMGSYTSSRKKKRKRKKTPTTTTLESNEVQHHLKQTN